MTLPENSNATQRSTTERRATPISLQPLQRNRDCNMGRPPLGRIAMTSTERSRRHRLKHRPEQPATKPSGDAALATAHARIAELERERTQFRLVSVSLRQ